MIVTAPRVSRSCDHSPDPAISCQNMMVLNRVFCCSPEITFSTLNQIFCGLLLITLVCYLQGKMLLLSLDISYLGLDTIPAKNNGATIAKNVIQTKHVTWWNPSASMRNTEVKNPPAPCTIHSTYNTLRPTPQTLHHTS